MPAIKLEGSVQAEYADGYIHDETDLEDTSPYGPFYETVPEYDKDNLATSRLIEQELKKNIFNDILEKRPEAEHGSMVRFSVFWKDQLYNIDWRIVPKNARPIRFKDMFATFQGTQQVAGGIVAVDFGYQYTDENGKNQEVKQRLE